MIESKEDFIEASFFLGTSQFSVYEEMGRQLLHTSDQVTSKKGESVCACPYHRTLATLPPLRWKRRKKEALLHCDLVLGDRFEIQYPTLRCAPLATRSLFGGIRWVNYFQGSSQITLKASMALLLKQEDPAYSAQYLPETYVLGGEVEKKEDERVGFLAAVSKYDDESGQNSSVWIVKPSTGAKGAGILFLRGVNEANAFIDNVLSAPPYTYPPEALVQIEGVGEPRGRLPVPRRKKKPVRCVAQMYIHRPLLLEGQRKFDIRVWVLLQSPYSIFVYSQGSCRTASSAYDLSDLTNSVAHLTNHCLQVGAEGYGAFEANNEIFFPQLDLYLSSMAEKQELSQNVSAPHIGGSVLEHHILPQISRIIIRTLLVMKPTMQLLPEDEAGSFGCFQLFGYDLMVDADLNVKLLEINGSPGIADKFLTSLVRDMLLRLYCRGFHEVESSCSADRCSFPLSAHPPTSQGVEQCSALHHPSRVWSIHKDEFVLLWKAGEDKFPDGLEHCGP